ncbi:hypothetical protein ACJX0J_031172, partial [Zea mays]
LITDGKHTLLFVHPYILLYISQEEQVQYQCHHGARDFYSEDHNYNTFIYDSTSPQIIDLHVVSNELRRNNIFLWGWMSISKAQRYMEFISIVKAQPSIALANYFDIYSDSPNPLLFVRLFNGVAFYNNGDIDSKILNNGDIDFELFQSHISNTIIFTSW